MKFVDFTGTTLLDLQGVRRDVLSGTFTAEELANRAVEEWIPYLECDQCGKSSYCRFTKPSPYVSGQLAEIRCGVAEKALHNFVNATFHLLEEADTTRLQDYLDGLHYFCRFVYETELLIGSFISDGIIGWYGEYAPALFGFVTDKREVLNRIAHHFRAFPEFRTKKGILLVEGKSELAFINKLKESQFAEFLYVLADEYEGKGNRHKKKIELLLKQYAAQGYRVFIQGDADGAAQSPFRSLIQSGLVDEADTFYFPYDFESSVPSTLLFVALNTLGRLTDVDIGDFETAVEGNTSSVATVLADKFQCDIKPIKVDLAKAVAEMINGLPNTYLSHEWLLESELGSFIKFLRRIP